MQTGRYGVPAEHKVFYPSAAAAASYMIDEPKNLRVCP